MYARPDLCFAEPAFHIQKSIVQIDKKYNLNRIEEYKISFFRKGFKDLRVFKNFPIKRQRRKKEGKRNREIERGRERERY